MDSRGSFTSFGLIRAPSLGYHVGFPRSFPCFLGQGRGFSPPYFGDGYTVGGLSSLGASWKSAGGHIGGGTNVGG